MMNKSNYQECEDALFCRDEFSSLTSSVTIVLARAKIGKFF